MTSGSTPTGNPEFPNARLAQELGISRSAVVTRLERHKKGLSGPPSPDKGRDTGQD